MKFIALKFDSPIQYMNGSFNEVESIVSSIEKPGFGNLGYGTLVDNLDSSIELLYADGILKEGFESKINPHIKGFSKPQYGNCCIVKFDSDYNMIDLSEEDFKFIKRLLNE